MSEVVGVKSGVNIGAQGVYSVVFTEDGDKTWFEVLVLKGVPRSPQQMLEDLRKAAAWMQEQEDYRTSVI